MIENFRLRVFRTVAEKMNFREAAETLYLTQPAVTLQIKTLEQELNTQLFDRGGSRITLTDARGSPHPDRLPAANCDGADDPFWLI